MDQCPKCGGTSGFRYDWVLRTHRFGAWGRNDDEESTAEVVREVKNVICMDCGKRIGWDEAHSSPAAS